MKKIKQFVVAFFYLAFIGVNAQNAPVTIAGSVLSLGTSVTVPVYALNFNDIGSCGLQLIYDPAIAVASSVTTGPLLGGGLNYNLTEPGKIILGWYAWPGISLPDSTIIFNIQFLKVTTGTSSIVWDDDGSSCYYSNGAAALLNDIPFPNFYHNGSVTFALPAPHTLAPVIKSGPGVLLDIPVKVTGFNKIGKVRLTIHYNPAVLSFQSWENTSLFPGLILKDTVPGTICIKSTMDPGANGFSLNDSSVLATLHCFYQGGTTELTWEESDTSCQYSGPLPAYPVLYDIPFGSWFMNGSVTQNLGIDDHSNSAVLSFYPNPFKSHGTLEWNLPLTGEVLIDVYTMTGEKVMSFIKYCEYPDDRKFMLSACNLVPGNYMVSASFPENRVRAKGVQIVVSQ